MKESLQWTWRAANRVASQVTAVAAPPADVLTAPPLGPATPFVMAPEDPPRYGPKPGLFTTGFFETACPANAAGYQLKSCQFTLGEHLGSGQPAAAVSRGSSDMYAARRADEGRIVWWLTIGGNATVAPRDQLVNHFRWWSKEPNGAEHVDVPAVRVLW